MNENPKPPKKKPDRTQRSCDRNVYVGVCIMIGHRFSRFDEQAVHPTHGVVSLTEIICAACGLNRKDLLAGRVPPVPKTVISGAPTEDDVTPITRIETEVESTT